MSLGICGSSQLRGKDDKVGGAKVAMDGFTVMKKPAFSRELNTLSPHRHPARSESEVAGSIDFIALDPATPCGGDGRRKFAEKSRLFYCYKPAPTLSPCAKSQDLKKTTIRPCDFVQGDKVGSAVLSKLEKINLIYRDLSSNSFCGNF